MKNIINFSKCVFRVGFGAFSEKRHSTCFFSSGGMTTFLGLAHALDATQLMGWGEGMITFLAVAYMVDASNMLGGVGRGDVNIL